MPRDGRMARERLQHAALELFAQHGFDRTTTAQIAARAGVSERTFFRHFPDKREVLFASEGELRQVTAEALAAVPGVAEPLAALRTAFHDVVPLIERGRPLAELRAPIIAGTPALLEREHTKTADLVALIAQSLARRGVSERSALLCARVGMASFSTAIHRWNPGVSNLHDEVDAAFDDLRIMAAALACATR